jgi:hypothetical protein
VAVINAAITKGRRSIWLAGMNATRPKATHVTNPLTIAPPSRRRKWPPERLRGAGFLGRGSSGRTICLVGRVGVSEARA